MGRSARVLVVLVVAVIMAACSGGGLPLTSEPPGSVPAGVASAVATESPTTSGMPAVSPTDSPPASPSPTPVEETPPPTASPPPTEPPTEPPTPEPTPERTPMGSVVATPEPTPEPTPTPTPELSCTGTASQQTMMRRLAAAVPWDVYCGVLPSGWRIVTLTTDLGRIATPSMLAQYNRTDGAFFQMVQGDVCVIAGAGCRPIGTRVGEVRVAGRSGLLYQVGGAHMVWVGRPSEYPAWFFAGSDDLAEAEFKKILSRIREVPG